MVWVGPELLEAAGAAERIGDSAQLVSVGTLQRIDLHSADGVDDSLLRRRGRVAILMVAILHMQFLYLFSALRRLVPLNTMSESRGVASDRTPPRDSLVAS